MRADDRADRSTQGALWRAGIRFFGCLFLPALLLAAQPSGTGARPVIPPPVLKAGEGLALTLGDGEVQSYGEARREAPMGGLAKLAWMRLEGAEWSSAGVHYRCKGTDGPFACTERGGHGRLDLGRALQEDCDLAFLVWIYASMARWAEDYGQDAARVRMEEAFRPFLGRRLPPGNDLPLLTAAWVGSGELLRTSPEAFLRWLMEPNNAEVVTFGKRYLAGYWVEFRDLFGQEGWWFKTGTAPVPGDPTATSAWAVAGRGQALVVLHLPKGRGKPDGMVRLREILGLKP